MQEALERVSKILADYRPRIAWAKDGRPTERLAYMVLRALPRRMTAVSLMSRHSLSLEADAVGRGIAEAAVNLCWVGKDDERATRVLVRGHADQLALLDDLAEHGFEMPPGRREHLESQTIPGAKLKKLPHIKGRIEQLQDVDGIPGLKLNAVRAKTILMGSGHASVHYDSEYMYAVEVGVDVAPTLLQGALNLSMLILNVTEAILGPDKVLKAVTADLVLSLK